MEGDGWMCSGTCYDNLHEFLDLVGEVVTSVGPRGWGWRAGPGAVVVMISVTTLSTSPHLSTRLPSTSSLLGDFGAGSLTLLLGLSPSTAWTPNLTIFSSSDCLSPEKERFHNKSPGAAGDGKSLKLID